MDSVGMCLAAVFFIIIFPEGMAAMPTSGRLGTDGREGRAAQPGWSPCRGCPTLAVGTAIHAAVVT